MLTNHCMYLQWYLELLSCSCGFNSRREHQFEAVMIEKVIAAFFVFWVEISTQMCGIWCKKEKGLSMNVNLVFLSV